MSKSGTKNGKRKLTQLFNNLRVIMRLMKLLSRFPFSDFHPPNFDMIKWYEMMMNAGWCGRRVLTILAVECLLLRPETGGHCPLDWMAVSPILIGGRCCVDWVVVVSILIGGRCSVDWIAVVLVDWWSLIGWRSTICHPVISIISMYRGWPPIWIYFI